MPPHIFLEEDFSVKLGEAIRKIDELKHNTYTTGEKIAWLSQLDGNIKALAIDTHECQSKEQAITAFIEEDAAKHEAAVLEYMKAHNVSRDEAEIQLPHTTYSYNDAKEQVELTRMDILFSGYTEETDPDTVLIVPAPWDALYLYWLEAQIDYYNGEMDRYNNAAGRFTLAQQEFIDHYHRTHRPISANKCFF